MRNRSENIVVGESAARENGQSSIDTNTSVQQPNALALVMTNNGV